VSADPAAPPAVEVHPSATRCEMTWIVMPGQTNALGTVFGGQVMAWIDVCAAVAAQRFARSDVVTAAMDQLIFRAPIRHGEIAVLQATVNQASRTSMEVGVRVESEDPRTGTRTHTSTAYLTFVSLDEQRRPRPLPVLRPQSDEERRRERQAIQRRDDRLAARERDRQRLAAPDHDAASHGPVVVLASASPRRRQLLAWSGVAVEVRPSHVDETRRPDEPPVAYAARLAEAKAAAGPADRTVVAADTVVHLDGDVLDKPADRAEARAHLRRLSGRWHDVTTAIAIRSDERLHLETVTTRVRFRALTDAEIDAYVATGEADDKAGAYGIQGRAGAFVAALDGSWTNVMGLPVEETLAALSR
jgi:septum formation protein